MADAFSVSPGRNSGQGDRGFAFQPTIFQAGASSLRPTAHSARAVGFTSSHASMGHRRFSSAQDQARPTGGPAQNARLDHGRSVRAKEDALRATVPAATAQVPAAKFASATAAGRVVVAAAHVDINTH